MSNIIDNHIKMENTFYSNQFFYTDGIQSMEILNCDELLINSKSVEKYIQFFKYIQIPELNITLHKFENNYLYGWDCNNQYYLFSNISMDYDDVFNILNKILSSVICKKKIDDMITQYKFIINARSCRVANVVLSLGDITQPISRQGYFPTLYPSERADLFRSHAVVNGGLPVNFHSNIKSESINNLVSPTFGYTREQEQLYIIGGSPAVLNKYIKGIINHVSECQSSKLIDNIPYVVLINSKSPNSEYYKTLLTIGNTINYIGGLLIHQNGYIYAVNRCVLYKIDPYNLTIIKYIKLPLIPVPSQPILEFETIYNGMQVIKNGRIIIKGYNFSDDDGIFLQIDPNDLNILVEKKINDPPVAPRISIYQDSNSGLSYYYSINTTEIERIIITDNDFIKDITYSAQYRTDESKNNPGNAVLIFDKINKIGFASNAFCGPEQGMQLYNYDLLNKSDVKLKFAFNFESNNPGYNFWMVASDNLINQYIISYDPITKKISCNKILENGEFIFIWERNDLTISACITCVADRNHLYTNDYVDGIDYFVILELNTGKELGRIKTNATLPTLGNIVPGMNNDVYLFSQQVGESNGYVTRFYI